MARTWKAWATVVAWMGAALPASAQFMPGERMPPPPTPIGVMVPVLPTSMPTGAMPPGLGGAQGALPGSSGDSGLPGLDPKYSRDNAFNDEHADDHGWPLRHQISFDWLILYFKAFDLPATVTTGNASDPIPGAALQPGTKLLHGQGRDNAGESQAFRMTWTSWLKDPEYFGFDASFMIMETRTQPFGFFSNDNGFPVLSRPYFDPTTETPNADPRAVPGAKAGIVRDFHRHRLMGAEGGPKWSLSGGYASRKSANITMTIGPRWLKLDESFYTDDVTQDLPVGSGQIFNIQDNFTTFNEFIGGQISLQARQRFFERCMVDVIAKFAVGQNFQYGRISGSTTVTDEVTENFTSTPQGFYAQPTNIGTYRQQQISVLPEFGVNVGYFITENFKFSVGYGIFWMNNVLRPPNMIDTTINIQPLSAANPIPPLRPARPQLETSDFWAHWINLSFEFVF